MYKAKKKSIGIIGGAGPMAGILLCEYIVAKCQQVYQCKEDADFPQIMLLSVPFVQMLGGAPKMEQELAIRSQLKHAMATLQLYSDSTGIACNTLHGFIDTDSYPGLIDLISVTRDELVEEAIQCPLILGTSTSVMGGVHDFDTKVYPAAEYQRQIDHVIDLVLSGDTSPVTQKLFMDTVSACVVGHKAIDAVVLGCTELSVLVHKALTTVVGSNATDLEKIRWIDPLKILARKLSEASFAVDSV